LPAAAVRSPAEAVWLPAEAVWLPVKAQLLVSELALVRAPEVLDEALAGAASRTAPVEPAARNQPPSS
jgi:hypothetical protein